MFGEYKRHLLSALCLAVPLLLTAIVSAEPPVDDAVSPRVLLPNQTLSIDSNRPFGQSTPLDQRWRDSAGASAMDDVDPDDTAANDDAPTEELSEAMDAVDRAGNETRELGQDTGFFRMGQSAREHGDAGAEESQLAAGSVGELIRVGGGLAVVLGLIFGLAMAARRFGGPGGRFARPSGVVQILARYTLGRGHAVVLIKIGRRVLVVHQGGGQLETLSEIVEPEEVAHLLARIEAGTRGDDSGDFQDLLSRAARDYEPFPNSARRYDRGDVETIDLTRTQSSGLRRAFSLKGMAG